MPKTSKIVVNEQPISVILSPGESDYISLTDMTVPLKTATNS